MKYFLRNESSASFFWIIDDDKYLRNKCRHLFVVVVVVRVDIIDERQRGAANGKSSRSRIV